MRRVVRGLAAVGVTAAVALGAMACGDDDGDAGTSASEGDGATLTAYSGRSEELVAPLFERFTADTGIGVEVRYGGTAEMAATIVEEGDSSPADVFFGQDGGALGALQKEERLAPLSQETLGLVLPGFRSAEGDWIGSSGRVRVLGYDNRELDQADLPASVLDLTGEEWSGRVGWAPANASFQAFVTAMRLDLGEDRTEQWLRDMQANGAAAYENNVVLRDAIANGEVDVGLLNHYYMERAKDELDDPSTYPVGTHVFPDGDVGSLINVAGAGVVASTDQRAEAERLVAYLAGPSAQEYFVQETKEYPVVPGGTGPEGLPALDTIEQPEVDLNDLDDLRGTLDLLERSGIL